MDAKWIATRQLNDPSGGRADLVVKLGIPQFFKEGHWECPFSIAEEGKPEDIKTSGGVDGFQAIVQAIEGICIELNSRGGYSFAGLEPGQTGFTRSVPIYLPPDWVRRLEAWVQAEAERYLAEMAENQRRQLEESAR